MAAFCALLMITGVAQRPPATRRFPIAAREASVTLLESAPTRRALLGASAALAAMPMLSVQPPVAHAAEVLVEGEVSLGALASQLRGKDVVVEIVARRLGKGIVATKHIEQSADQFPTRFFVYAEDLNQGISLEKTRGDDIFLLATLDVPSQNGSLKRVAQVQGKAPIKKGERLKPLLLLE